MIPNAIIYVPSDTPEAMTMATKSVAGVPLIVRAVMTLAQAEVETCTLLIARTQQRKIETFLERYKNQYVPKINFIHYDEPYSVSPETIRLLANSSKGKTILVNSNFLFEKDLVKLSAELSVSGQEIGVLLDGAHPLPFYVVNSDQILGLKDFTASTPRSVESCIRELENQFTVKPLSKPSESHTFLVSHLRDRAVAEKSLAETIRLRVLGPVARYLNKRISLPISLILSKLWISPNTITAFNIIIGVFSGVFVADGHRYFYILFGAFLFQAASVIDGCDGEVAKLTFRCTKFGQYADTLCDNLSLASFIIGLIAGYWRHTHSPIAFILGAILIICASITIGWMVLFLKKNTHSASLVTYDTEYLQKMKNQPRLLMTVINYGKYMLKKDFFSFAFLCFAIFDILYYVLFIATLGTIISATILTYFNVREIYAQKKSALVA